MAAYVKDRDSVVLLMSKAEAAALNEFVQMARIDDELDARRPANGETAKALDRATRALDAASNSASRTGARID